MREIGLLIWIVLLFVGVISSILSTVRKAAAARPSAPSVFRTASSEPVTPPPREATVRELVAALQAQARAQAAPPPAQPAPASAPAPPPRPRPAPPIRQAQAPELHAWPTSPHRAKRRRLFSGKNDVVRGIVAAEVLGSPRGLRDEPFWR
jgi:hypothetical protein